MLSAGTAFTDRSGGVEEALRLRVCVCYEKFGAKQQKVCAMSGEEGTIVVPVNVVQGIVQQLATVSQHTTTATTA